MIKTAILIDGAYFLARLPAVQGRVDASNAVEVAEAVYRLVNSHLRQLNNIYNVPNFSQLLFRTFYYDARPYQAKAHTPIGRKAIDYRNSKQALFRNQLFSQLHGKRNLAVRLGDVRRAGKRSWLLKPDSQAGLLAGRIGVQDLTDQDFTAALRQKGVDMRIGLDIASIALKRQADIVILVSGDADFVPAAKLARREGVQFVLDPLWQNISPDLFEHIDALRSGFPKPRRQTAPAKST